MSHGKLQNQILVRSSKLKFVRFFANSLKSLPHCDQWFQHVLQQHTQKQLTNQYHSHSSLLLVGPSPSDYKAFKSSGSTRTIMPPVQKSSWWSTWQHQQALTTGSHHAKFFALRILLWNTCWHWRYWWRSLGQPALHLHQKILTWLKAAYNLP